MIKMVNVMMDEEGRRKKEGGRRDVEDVEGGRDVGKGRSDLSEFKGK